MGNIIGLGDNSKETLSSVIDLRFSLMSKFKLKSDSIIFLRGAQEEMFSKLLQLQLAPNPVEIVKWMFDHGVNKSINSYGFTEDEVSNIASTGTIKITKWTSNLNKVLKKNPGHTEYFLNLKHAAYSQSKKILFVNRGVDITRPLSAQNDCFGGVIKTFPSLKSLTIHLQKLLGGMSLNTMMGQRFQVTVLSAHFSNNLYLQRQYYVGFSQKMEKY